MLAEIENQDDSTFFHKQCSDDYSSGNVKDFTNPFAIEMTHRGKTSYLALKKIRALPSFNL